jgi:hypothetical protein
MTRRSVCLGIVALSGVLAVRGGAAEPETTPNEQLTPVLASILAAPQAALFSDGRWVVPYEIALVNVADVPMTLESVAVSDAHGTIATLAGAELASHLSIPAVSRDDLDGESKTPRRPVEVHAAVPAIITDRLPADLAVVRFAD